MKTMVQEFTCIKLTMAQEFNYLHENNGPGILVKKLN